MLMNGSKILNEAMVELADYVKAVLADRIERFGYNRRAKKNTLKGSNLESSIKVTTVENELALSIASYWEHISRGWIRTHNYGGTYNQFVTNIIAWVKKKGLREKFKGKTDNQIAFMFFKFFTENGIHYRPFMVYDDEGDLTEMIPELKEYMNKWVDDLFEKITEDLDNYFN